MSTKDNNGINVLVFPKDIPRLKNIVDNKNCTGVYVVTQGSGLAIETTSKNLRDSIGLNKAKSLEFVIIPSLEPDSYDYLVKVVSITL